MTAFGTVEEAVRAMKDGAADFLTKPVDTDHLLLLLDRAVEKRRMVTELVLLKEDYQRRFGLPRVLGEDPALKEAMLALQRAAATDATVLLLGESGTGKELMRRALHQLSPRAKGPVRRDQLRGDPGEPARERAVRPREGRLHRAPRRARSARPSWPTGARCSSTRSATCRCRCRARSCASCRSSSSSASAGCRR